VQEGLKRLWEHAFTGIPWQGLQADKWVDMGWQRNDPSSDFRGAGLIALHNHLYMAQVSLLLALQCNCLLISSAATLNRSPLGQEPFGESVQRALLSLVMGGMETSCRCALALQCMFKYPVSGSREFMIVG